MDRIPDVSNFQGQVDWNAVLASGRVGGICKATEGSGFVDSQFIRNWTTLGKLGAKVRGAYHFARPTSSNPIDQANRFLQVVGTVLPTDTLVLDIEVGDGDLSNWALLFLEAVQGATGTLPWLYSYAPFIRAHLQKADLARFPLWLAAYQPGPPATPAPWATWTLWQHTDKAQIPGIPGKCDESMGNLSRVAPPAPTPKVVPMHQPALVLEPIVADLACPTGGAWLLSVNGAIYAFGGAAFKGGANGQAYFADRQAARLEPLGSGYRIIATSGETYDYP